MSLPRFSIIIPVTHSLADLDLCLESVARLKTDGFALQAVLVDCGVLPGLAAKAAAWQARAPALLRVVALPAGRPPAHAWVHEYRLNEARNAAVRAWPAEVFVFTEDDCSFEPDWLFRLQGRLEARPAILGGTDRLPDGMGLFAEALDCLLNSPLGSPGGRRGHARHPERFVPIKDFMVVPAAILDRIGPFPEDKVFGAERIMAERARRAGYEVVFVEDAPVWHRRTTTLGMLLLRDMTIAAEKTATLRGEGRFLGSAHSLLLAALVAGMLAVLLAVVHPAGRWLLAAGGGTYVAADLVLSAAAAARKRCIGVGLLHAVLLPLHHASVALGVLSGLGRGARVRGGEAGPS